MAAVVNVYCATGAGPTYATAEGGVLKFGLDDTITSSTPVPIPTALGTNFSWQKNLRLYCVSGGGSTSLLNRKAYLSGAVSDAHCGVYYLTTFTSTYTQANTTQGTAAGNRPASTGAALAAPTNFTAMPTSSGAAVTVDSSTIAATNATANGNLLTLVIGVDNSFAAGAGAFSLPNIMVQYDEA